MKTLSEHNADRSTAHQRARLASEPHPNGIECPECKAELWDTDPLSTFTTDPPQKNVHCAKCSYRGYRIA